MYDITDLHIGTFKVDVYGKFVGKYVMFHWEFLCLFFNCPTSRCYATLHAAAACEVGQPAVGLVEVKMYSGSRR